MAWKETRKYGPCAGKKKKPKTVPEEAQKLELFDKGFKSAFPNMFKKLENIS